MAEMAIPLYTFEFEGCDEDVYPRGAWRDLGQTSRDWLTENLDEFLWDPALIVREALPYTWADGPDRSGVYFLVKDSTVTYVGISKCIRDRLCQHCGLMPFNRYWCFGGIPERFIKDVESFYIHALKCPLNYEVPYLGDALKEALDGITTGKRAYKYS